MQSHIQSFRKMAPTAAAVLLLWLGGARAQVMEVGEARKVSAEAQQLAAKKEWTKAISVLQHGLRRCGSAPAASRSRGILHFSLGYLYQQMAEDDAAPRTARLKQASVSYQNALKELPDNAQVMNNLTIVLKQLGQWRDAAAVLRRAANADIERRGSYSEALAELHLEQANIPAALHWYREAAKANPSDKSLHWKILSVYRANDDVPLQDLLDYSKHLVEINQPGPAKDGFEQVINRGYDSQTSLSVQALLYWAELGAVHGWISAESLRLLPSPEQWNSPPIRELRALLSEPEGGRRHLDWWARGLIPRHVASSVLKTLGRDCSAKGDLEKSLQLYEAALELAPPPPEYKSGPLAGKPIVALDVRSELANLYLRHPRFDPGGEKLQHLIVQLFEWKGEAYQQRSMVAIERYHTMLGLIYAEKGLWRSSGRADNAIFQLEHALLAARERAAEDPKAFRPLPHLEGALAKGYVAVDKLALAHKTYVDSAIGYLDLDDLGKADEMLTTAERFSDAANNERLQAVAKILGSRKAVRQVQAQNFAPASAQYYGQSARYRWLFGKEILKLDRAFVNRQRFKTLADLGHQASNLGAAAESLRLQTRALDVIKAEPTLTNMQDVIRLKRMKDAVIQCIDVKSKGQVMETGRGLEKSQNYKSGKVWHISTAQTAAPIQVGINKDLLLAGAVGNRLSYQPAFVSGEIKLQLRDGKATLVPKQPADRTARESATILRTIEGVRDVKIRQKR